VNERQVEGAYMEHVNDSFARSMYLLRLMQLKQGFFLMVDSDRKWRVDGQDLRRAVYEHSVGSDLFTLLVSILLLSLSTLLLSILVEESLLQQSETLVHTSLSALKALDLVVGASDTVDVDTKTGVNRVVETEDDGQESLDTFHGVLL
jgi:hypothetical protein